MPAADRLLELGRQRGRRLVRQLGAEVRHARLQLGLSQAATARAARVSRAWLGRFERGEVVEVGLVTIGRVGRIVGLELSARFFAAGARLRDAAQIRLLQRLRMRAGPGWRWRFEVSLPIPGDQRAWDAVMTRGAVQIHVEAVSRIHDLQDLLRRIELKRRDGGAERVILLVADTAHDRDSIRAAREELATAFPIPQRRALAALTAGRDPGGDAVIVL